MTEPTMHRMCVHCGAEDEPRLGFCDQCERPVCAKCGNIQYVSGERKVLHDTCLKYGEDSGFSMIKFIR